MVDFSEYGNEKLERIFVPEFGHTTQIFVSDVDDLNEDGGNHVVGENTNKTLEYAGDQPASNPKIGDVYNATKDLIIAQLQITRSVHIGSTPVSLKASNNPDENSGTTLLSATMSENDTVYLSRPITLPAGKYLTLVVGDDASTTPSITTSKLAVIERGYN